MYPTLFTIPYIDFPISTFGVMMAIAFLTGSKITAIRMKEEGLDPDLAYTLLVYVMLGGIIGCEGRTLELLAKLEQGVETVKASAATLPSRPRVFFEEWDDPLISGIRWVSELIEIAGGEDCFPELAACPLGKDRIIADPLEVVRRQPDIIIGSWCGKKFRPGKVAARPGWSEVPAVVSGQLHEIKSPLILQPGPAALTDGLAALHKIIADWAVAQPA